jgi:hypothetical protein
MDKHKGLYTDMDYRDEVSFQDTSGIVKKFLQGLLLLLVLGALGGVFGYGTWTKETCGKGSSVEVEYERFLRVTKKTPLTFTVRTEQPDTLKIKIGASYFDKVSFESISPKPLQVSLDKEQLCFYFKVDKPGDQKIIFSTSASSSGKLLLNTDIDQTHYTIHQFIYP